MAYIYALCHDGKNFCSSAVRSYRAPTEPLHAPLVVYVARTNVEEHNVEWPGPV